MIGFISQSNNEEEINEQIRKQSNLGFWGYFMKKMFRRGMTYNQGVFVDKKKALEVITARQNLFLLVRTNHADECIPLLKEIYGNIPSEYLDMPGPKDVTCCIKFGDIYVTEEDSDISQKYSGFFSRFLKARKYNIYLPPKYTSSQLEELNNVYKIREDFKKWFGKDEIEVCHYKDYKLDEKEIYSGKEALIFLKNEFENKKNVDDTIENQFENIILDSKATFVKKVDTTPVSQKKTTDNTIRNHLQVGHEEPGE